MAISTSHCVYGLDLEPSHEWRGFGPQWEKDLEARGLMVVDAKTGERGNYIYFHRNIYYN